MNGRRLAANMIIAPNPAQSILNISFVSEIDAKNAEITISDMNGQIFRKETMAIGKGTNIKNLNVNEFKPGVYIISIAVKDSQHQQVKFIKQ